MVQKRDDESEIKNEKTEEENEEEMVQRRRRRVEEWQELRRKEESKKENPPESGKMWTLDGESDDDEAGKAVAMEVDDEEIDPLDAFMDSVVLPQVEKQNDSVPAERRADGRIFPGENYDSDYGDVDDDENDDEFMKRVVEKISIVDHSKIEYPTFRKSEPDDLMKSDSEEEDDDGTRLAGGDSDLAARAAAIAASFYSFCVHHNLKKILADAIPEHYTAELEINDFPQNARWKIKHKEETLGPISEWSGAAITTRGQYYPPGWIAEPGKRKLYLFIEAPLEKSVKMARDELKRVLEDIMNQGSSLPGSAQPRR